MIVFLLQSFSHYSYIENRIGRYRVIPESRSKVRLKKTPLLKYFYKAAATICFL